MNKKQTPSRTKSLSEQRAASARKYNDIRNELRSFFAPMQQAAQEVWLESEEEPGTEELQEEHKEFEEELPPLALVASETGEEELEEEFATFAGAHFALAASGTKEEKPLEYLSLAPVGTFEIEGVPYEALKDLEENVFLAPSPHEKKIHLILDGELYLLRRIEGENRCQVVDLGVGDLLYFLGIYKKEPGQHNIQFREQ